MTSWFDVTETRSRMTHQHYSNDSLEGQWFEFYKRYHTEQIFIPSKLLKSEARKHKMIVFFRFVFSFTFDWLCYRKFKQSALSCLPGFQSVYTLHVLYLSKFNSVIITLIPLSSCPPSASQLVSLPYYLFIYLLCELSASLSFCPSGYRPKLACKWVQSRGWFWKMWNLQRRALMCFQYAWEAPGFYFLMNQNHL